MLLPQPMARRCCSDMQRRSRSEARYGPLCFSVVVVSPRDEVYGWDVLLPVRLWGTTVRDALARQVATRLYLERVPRLIDRAPVGHCRSGMVDGKRHPAVRKGAHDEGRPHARILCPPMASTTFRTALKLGTSGTLARSFMVLGSLESHWSSSSGSVNLICTQYSAMSRICQTTGSGRPTPLCRRSSAFTTSPESCGTCLPPELA